MTTPATPTRILAEPSSISSITVYWSSSGAYTTHYLVEVSLNGGGTWAQVAQVLYTKTVYVHTGLVAGTEYCYKVRAMDAAGPYYSVYTSQVCATTLQVSTDNAIARYTGADLTLQNSLALLDDTGNITTPGTIASKPASTAGLKLDPNAATGNYTLSFSTANLTGNRRHTFPNYDMTWPASDAAGVLTSSGAGILSWVASPPPGPHTILSHSDALSDTIADGDVLIGNSTPKLARLAISVPAANVRNVFGIDNAELRPSWKTALDSTNPTTIGVADAGGPGTSLVFSHRDHQHPSPATWTPSAHNQAETTITFTDLTTGDSSTTSHGYLPKAVAPAANLMNVAGIVFGETAWSNKAIFDATVPETLTAAGAAAAGTATVAAHRDHVHPITAAVGLVGNAGTQWKFVTSGATPFTAVWSDFSFKGTTGGTVSFAVTNAKTLTLTATDDFNLTISGNASIGGTAITGTPGTLTVSTANAAADPHTHAITSSSNPGAAASILASTAAGLLTLVGLTTTAVASVTTPADSWVGPSLADGLYFKNNGLAIGGVAAWAGNSLAISRSSFGYHLSLVGCSQDLTTDINGVSFALTHNVAGNRQIAFVDNVTNVGFRFIPSANYMGGYNAGALANMNLMGTMYVTTGNQVGIGVAAPSTKLHVVGTADVQQFLVVGFTTQTSAVAQVTRNDVTAGVSAMLGLTAKGSAAIGDGGSIIMAGLTSVASQTMARIYWLWTDPTSASRKADLVASAWDTAEREGWRIRGSGSAAMIGFLGATPVVQQLATTDLGVVLSNLGLRAAGTAYPITTSGAVNLQGVTKLGDGATNYSQFDTDGDLTQTGTARIDWTKKTAASVTLTAGTTPASLVADLRTAGDGLFYHIDEAAATPGINLMIEFTSITAFNWVNVLAWYDGSATHAVAVQLYNWVSAAYDTFSAIQTGMGNVTTAGGYILDNTDFFVPSDANYIGTAGGGAGKVRVRLYHTMGGSASHNLDIDVVALYQ